MGRRGATVAVGALLLIVLLWQAATTTVPYVELGPGPTVDTLGDSRGKPVIAVTGASASASAGQLRLTTVNVQSKLTIVDAVRGWLRRDYAVVPRELVYPPDKTQQQIEDENAQQFRQSQTSAETVALRKLGYPVLVTVTDVASGYPAYGVLQKDDVINAVDGTPVTSLQKLSELVRAKPVGTVREVAYTRNGARTTASIATKNGEDGNPRLGVSVEPKQPAPFEVTVELDRIGGPSAGLMFSLGIIDKLDPADLTGGIRFAGTGTIDDEGNVGPIGGVPQKLVAAKRDGATVFLTPAGNCTEASANAVFGLMLVEVATVDDALNAMRTMRERGTPPLCTR
jgi:PDZ domain-containing protein